MRGVAKRSDHEGVASRVSSTTPRAAIKPLSAMADHVVLRFSEVTFDYGETKPILDEASFSVRNGNRIALMGQNGAGKSTLFKMILGELKPKSGGVFKTPN